MACTAPNQIDYRAVCAKIFKEAAGIGFIDSKASGFARLAVSAVNTRAGIEGSIAADDLYFIQVLSTEDRSADIVVSEVVGRETFIKQGEYRYKVEVKADYATWAELANYNYFTGGEAYIYTKDSKVTYINDGETTPAAYGLPLGMVEVDRPPVFSNGADPALFYLYVNIDPNLFDGIEDADLDFPISTIDPTGGA